MTRGWPRPAPGGRAGLDPNRQGTGRMAYGTIEDLPVTVRKRLTEEAQELYRRVFNEAWLAASGDDDGSPGTPRRAAAHGAAWTAVLEQYEPADEGKWQPKPRR